MVKINEKDKKDKKCKCHSIAGDTPMSVGKLDLEFCKKWDKEEKKLEDNKIIFDISSDEYSACTCPTCGRIVCGWCS